LYGVVKQMGSLNGGHYIACCKNPINDKWYEFDDSHVTGIPTAKVENEVISRSAYMLFYKKQYTTTEIDDSSN
jgi:ubiquitin C-terminal hydrolase